MVLCACREYVCACERENPNSVVIVSISSNSFCVAVCVYVCIDGVWLLLFSKFLDVLFNFNGYCSNPNEKLSTTACTHWIHWAQNFCVPFWCASGKSRRLLLAYLFLLFHQFICHLDLLHLHRKHFVAFIMRFIFFPLTVFSIISSSPSSISASSDSGLLFLAFLVLLQFNHIKTL